MDNDTYCFQCPACSSVLELDVDGNITQLEEPELKANQRRGIGSLVTETNVADRFYQDDYLRNQSPKPTMQPLGAPAPIATPEPIEIDPAVIAANETDLKRLNLK